MRILTSLFSVLIVIFALTISGCETTDRVLTAAERVTKGQTGQAIIDLASGKNPAKIAKRRLKQYVRGQERP